MKLALLEAAAALLGYVALRRLVAETAMPTRAGVDAASRTGRFRRELPHLAALAAIVLVGGAGRLAHLSQPMRYDEAWTHTYFVSRPLGEALADYRYNNNHLAHTLLAHLALDLFGDSPRALRLPALLGGILLLPATYLLARGLVDRRAGLFAAAAVAGSAPLVLYSTNARGYSLVGVAATLVFTLIGALADDPASRWKWIALAVLAALGMWVTPSMLYPLSGAALWFLFDSRAILRREPARWLARAGASTLLAIALTLMLYAPVLVRSSSSPYLGLALVTSASRSQQGGGLPRLLGELGRDWGAGLPTWGGLLVAGGIALALFAGRDGARRALALAAAVALAAVLLIVATGSAPPTRVLLYALPLLATLFGTGAGCAADWFAGRLRAGADVVASVAALALATAMTAAMVGSRAVLLSKDSGTFRDAARMAALLLRERRPDDFVVVSAPSGPPLVYYARRLGLPAGRLYGRRYLGDRLLVVVNRDEEQSLLSVLRDRTDVSPDCSTPPRVLARLPSSYLVEVRQAPRDRKWANPGARLAGCGVAGEDD